MTLKELKDAMNQWVTVKEAADILETTERTIYRQMKSGKISSRLENDRRLVAINCHDAVLTPEERHSEQIEHLERLLSEKDARIEQLENQLEHLTQLKDVGFAVIFLQWHRKISLN